MGYYQGSNTNMMDLAILPESVNVELPGWVVGDGSLVDEEIRVLGQDPHSFFLKRGKRTFLSEHLYYGIKALLPIPWDTMQT